MISKKKNNYEKFDINILYRFKYALYSLPNIVGEEMSLFDTVYCRVESAIHHLNKNIKYPMNETEFITFLVYSCMIKDGIRYLYEKIFGNYPYISELNYFKQAQQNEFLRLNENNYISDDKFFEYIRSIVFAHPYNTDRIYKKLFGTQISPYVLPGIKHRSSNIGIKDPVGALIHASSKGSPLLIEVSFEKLLQYINSKYVILETIIEWLINKRSILIEKWRTIKAERENDPILSIVNIMNVLKERKSFHSGINQLYFYLMCGFNTLNLKCISVYREAIERKINELLVAVNEINYDMVNLIVEDLTCIPRNIKGDNYYQIEKIYAYLPENDVRTKPKENSSEEYGLIQASEFAEGFAKKWVSIDIETMSNSEIKLLVATACYLECHKREYKYLIK